MKNKKCCLFLELSLATSTTFIKNNEAGILILRKVVLLYEKGDELVYFSTMTGPGIN